MSKLSDLCWPEIGTHRVLLVPCGSCEQHGPHLPFDTDTLIAQSFADALCSTRPHMLVAPPIGVGASGEHQSFPGTLSIGTDAMTAVAIEIARSALPDADDDARPRPFGGLLFVNGHGGNVEALQAASSVLLAENRNVGVWHPRVPDGDPHAGHTETSLMLHLHPERVRMNLAEIGSTARFRDIGEVLRAEGLIAVTPNGVLGDPTRASASAGAELFSELLSDLERHGEIISGHAGNAS